MHRLVWPASDLELVGSGQAFEETAFALPRQGLAIDGGWGRSVIFAQPTLFLSHLHLDHALGLPRYVVNRQKMGDGRCRILVPAAALASAGEIVDAFQRAEGRSDPVDWVGLEPGVPVPLEGAWRLRPLAAIHGIPAMGFVLEQRLRRLRSGFEDLDPVEVGRRVRAGEDLVDERWEPWFAYTGDTEIGMLDAHPELYEARVLLVECTFVGALHGAAGEAPPTPGHIHWEQLRARAEHFRNEAVVLTHFSRRYRPGELWRFLDADCPEPLRARLRPLITLRGTDSRSD